MFIAIACSSVGRGGGGGDGWGGGLMHWGSDAGGGGLSNSARGEMARWDVGAVAGGGSTLGCDHHLRTALDDEKKMDN